MDTITLFAEDLRVAAPYVITDAAVMITIQDNIPVQPDCEWKGAEFLVESGEIVFHVGSVDLPDVPIFRAWKAVYGELRLHTFISNRTGEAFTVAMQDRQALPLKRLWE